MGIDFGKLNQFADKVLEKKKSAIGYQVNQNTSLDEFYKRYVEKKLYCVSMNNVGDPCRRERDSNYSGGKSNRLPMGNLKSRPKLF